MRRYIIRLAIGHNVTYVLIYGLITQRYVLNARHLLDITKRYECGNERDSHRTRLHADFGKANQSHPS